MPESTEDALLCREGCSEHMSDKDESCGDLIDFESLVLLIFIVYLIYLIILKM